MWKHLQELNYIHVLREKSCQRPTEIGSILTDFLHIQKLNHIVAVGAPAAAGGVVFFRLTDHLVSTASTVAAEQVASMLLTNTMCCGEEDNSQKQPARFNCTLEDPYRELG